MSEKQVVKHALPMELKDGKRHAWPTYADMVYLNDGKTPLANEDGLLITDKALDAEKLGGKEPAYYTNPRNLLRNSNFADPINTNGFVSGSMGQFKESINDWILQYSTTLTLADGYVRLSDYYDIRQIVEATIKGGHTYTVAAKMRSAGAERTLWLIAENTSGSVRYSSTTAINRGEWEILINTFTPQSNIEDLNIYITNSGDTSVATDIEWIALYEGEYTADNVPPPFIYPKRLEMLNLGIPVQPVNLLINSDFRNPVNKLGYTKFIPHEYPEGQYLIDRWKISWNSCEATVNDGYIRVEDHEMGYNHIRQHVNKVFSKDTNVTFAVKLRGIGCGLCYYGTNATMQDYADWTILVYNYTIPAGANLIEGNDYNPLITWGLDCWAEIEWAALYEGIYTAETLPLYLPKGYENELLACEVAENGDVFSKFDEQMTKYRTAVNLLDNSDWRIKKNIVNQRGQDKYVGIAEQDVYTIDRWVIPWQEGLEVTVGDGYIQKGDKLWQQRFENIDPAKVYTGALAFLDGTTYVHSGTFADGFGNWNDSFWCDTKSGYFAFTIRDKATRPMIWAALYEGEYTAETLPPYVPKGYAVELVECMRYAYVEKPATGYETPFAYGYSNGSFCRVVKTLPAQQRLSKPSINSDGVTWSVMCNGQQYPVSAMYVMESSGNRYMIQAEAAGMAVGHLAVLISSGDANIVISSDM